MTMKRIDRLYGEAYNEAIKQAATELNEAFDFEMDPRDTTDVEEMAMEYGLWFDENGNLTCPEERTHKELFDTVLEINSEYTRALARGANACEQTELLNRAGAAMRELITTRGLGKEYREYVGF